MAGSAGQEGLAGGGRGAVAAFPSSAVLYAHKLGSLLRVWILKVLLVDGKYGAFSGVEGHRL